jgi:hypothetical protein
MRLGKTSRWNAQGRFDPHLRWEPERLDSQAAARGRR